MQRQLARSPAVWGLGLGLALLLGLTPMAAQTASLPPAKTLAAEPAPAIAPPAAVRIDFTADSAMVSAIQGLANRTEGRALQADDPVRIASVSKLFVALAVARLAERGEIDPDADVNTYLTWSLRHPDFPDEPITLAQLLSHRSGLRDGIDYALPMDALLADELRAPAAWDQRFRPGAYFHYANLNFPVIAAVLEAATQKRFDRIMHDEIFVPLQIDACFNWIGCSAAKRARAVTLYRADGTVARDDPAAVHSDCTIVPARDGGCDLSRYRLGQTGSIFSPQGGLRISAQDLAKVGQVMLRGKAGFLSAASMAKLTRPLWRYDGQNGNSEAGFFCAYAMGLHILRSDNAHPGCVMPFAKGGHYIGHAGEAYALTSGLWWSPATGRGVAFFRTQVPEAEAVAHCIWPCHIGAR